MVPRIPNKHLTTIPAPEPLLFAPSTPTLAGIALQSPALADLEVLVLDCQTTGSSPEKGRVLEIAWSRGRAADGAWGASPTVVSHLVKLPRGERLPSRIARLTGIAPRDLVGAPTREEVWRGLRDHLRGDRRPTGVAHFARFERAFLEDWRRRGGDDSERTPLELLCTHEIAIRLLPGLPRRGLRAVAGHLGHVMAEERRARGHVTATVAVWCALVEKLGELGVTTRADLSAWLREAKPIRRGGREFSLPREERLALPDRPGVYQMQGRGGEVLYVGKATSLRQRVNSYFRTRHRRPGGDRTLEMLTQVAGVEVTPCGSPLEAALREADAIKEHAPPYNVALRGREVEVYFASTDLATVRPVAVGKHQVGPLPRRDSLAPLWALRRLLRNGIGPAQRAPLWMLALGFGVPRPQSLRPLERGRLDERGLREGLALFTEHVGWTGRPDLPAPEMLRAGERLWREHLAEREERSTEDEEPPPVDEDSPRDPEDVARWFALAVGRCAQLVQRSKWFVKLCESSLWWRPAGGEAQLLRVERGELESCRAAEEAPPGERAPVPRGAALTALARRRSFDAAAYDRLRVLTTELRRIIKEGAEIELRLGAGRPLKGASIARRIEGV